MNFPAVKALIDQLSLAYQLAKKLQDNKGVKINNIFCLISKTVIHSHTGQSQVTANDSVDGVLGDIIAAGAIAAWKIANYVMDGCGLSHAGANLQEFGNFGDNAGLLYGSNSGPVFNGRATNAGLATTQSWRLPKENGHQIKEGDRQYDFPTNTRVTVVK